MIYIKVELWPKGDPTKAEHLGEVKIWNEEKPLAANGAKRYGFVARLLNAPEVHGTDVLHYPEQWLWELVRRVLSHDAFGKRRTLPDRGEDPGLCGPRVRTEDPDDVRAVEGSSVQ